MSNFIEERLEYDDIRLGASYTDEYVVKIKETASGQENRRLVHPIPRRSFVVTYSKATADLWDDVLSLYHRCYGMFSGFRFKTFDDFSTNGYTSAPTATDQTLELVSAGVYQLVKEYGLGDTAIGIGYPTRTIYKPVTGTTKVSVSGVELTSGWTVDTTTGKITFSANKTDVITAITKAASAVVTVGSHTFIVGDSVLFASVAGMTEINGLRAAVTAITGTTITVNINSTAFTTYTSGGTVNTRPQVGEAVKGGCEFDIPVRFNSKVEVIHSEFAYRDTASVDIVELLTP